MQSEHSKKEIQDTKNKLIEARDAFEKHRQYLAKKEKKTLITLKTNLPGTPKNTWYSEVLLSIFHKLISETFTIHTISKHQSFAGDSYFYTVEAAPEKAKKQCMIFEHEHHLGRFIDLDVHYRKDRYNREDYQYPPRRCFVCDDFAHICTRDERHSKEALRGFIENRTVEYLLEALSNNVAIALEREVYLYPKFGLVSHKDSGAHKDMNIKHFLASIHALKPWFKTFLEVGCHLEKRKNTLRGFGIAAEKAMFEATNKINTHKGAIFIFGAFLPFFMDGIMKQKSLDEVISSCAQFVREVTKDDFIDLEQKTSLTAGEIIYQKYGLKGIREEVSQGFPSIMSWYNKQSYSNYQKLCAIMMRLDDTTIIKRHNLTTLKNVQKDMSVLLKNKPFDTAMYEKLSEDYKAKGISPGGSADIYALVCFLDLTKHLLKNKQTID